MGTFRITIGTIWIKWNCRHRLLEFFNCCLDSIISILHYNFSVNLWEQQSAHFMSLFNLFQKSLLTLGKRLARKDSCGFATVVYGRKILVLHISDINGNGIIVSSTSPDATIAVFKLSLVRTEFVGKLDLANLILFEPCLSATSLSSLFQEGGLGGVLPFPFLRILLPIKTTELVTKLIKLSKIAQIPSHWSAPHMYPLQSRLQAVLSGQRLMT
jgi:hypothetical protein